MLIFLVQVLEIYIYYYDTVILFSSQLLVMLNVLLTHQMIDVAEGGAVDIDVKGKRVAFRCSKNTLDHWAQV